MVRQVRFGAQRIRSTYATTRLSSDVARRASTEGGGGVLGELVEQRASLGVAELDGHLGAGPGGASNGCGLDAPDGFEEAVLVAVGGLAGELPGGEQSGVVGGVADHGPLAAHGGVVGEVDERRAAQDGWGLLLELREDHGRAGDAGQLGPAFLGGPVVPLLLEGTEEHRGFGEGAALVLDGPRERQQGGFPKALGLQRRVEPAQGREHRGGSGGGAGGGLGEDHAGDGDLEAGAGLAAPEHLSNLVHHPLVVPPVAAAPALRDREPVTSLPHAQGGRRDPRALGQVADGQTTRFFGRFVGGVDAGVDAGGLRCGASWGHHGRVT